MILRNRCACALLGLAFGAVSAGPAGAATETVFQVADLVKGDPAPALPQVGPQSVLVRGDYFLFVGARLDTGAELWRSDGTAAGTTLVMDIDPGTGGSGIVGLVRLGGLTLFFADDGSHGYELWRTDGTTAGTSLVRDICSGTCDGASIRNVDTARNRVLAVAGDYAYFAGNDGVHGTELWRSDGTTAGTAMVADLWPGEEGSWPYRFFPVGGEVFFVARVASPGRLWRSDGTEAGTVKVSDVGSTDVYWGIDPAPLAALGDQLLFSANDVEHGNELWRSDGTEAGTSLVADICPGVCSGLPMESGYPDRVPVWRGRAFFQAASWQTGSELWETDGTSDGTRLVRDFNPGPGAGVYEIAPAAEKLYLIADDGVHGQELWVGDGTAAETHMIHDFWPGKGGIGGSNFVALGGLLFFAGEGGIWRSDGTLAGTSVIFSPYALAWGSRTALPLAEFAGELLFMGSTEDGTGFLLSDGTRPGTRTIFASSVAESNVPGTYPGDLRPVAGGLTFFSDRTTERLWYTEAQPGTTVPVATDHYDVGSGAIASLGSDVYFLGGRGLWRSSLTTQVVTLVYSKPFSNERMSDLTAAGDRVYLVDEPVDGDGKEVLVVDPSGNGASVVKDICQSECWATYPASLTPFGSRLAFTANTHGIYDGGVWVTDGSEPGTVEVAPLGGESYTPLNDYALTASGSLLYFAATEAGTGQELRVSDGSPSHSVLLRDICPGECSGLSVTSTWREIGVWRIVAAQPHRVYFLGDDGSHGQELWVSDGTPGTTRMVSDLTEGPGSSVITWMTAAGSGLYFAFDDGEHGRELWHTDGTTAGTRLVSDINAGLRSSAPQYLVWADDVLLFAATDGLHGLEPWRSDGTSWGTRQIADIVPGPGSSSPQELTRSGFFVYFRAYELLSGYELWAAELDGGGRVRRRLPRR